MRPVPFTAIKGGINRLRTKGGARMDVLYDLVNGRVCEDLSIEPRGGSTRAAVLNSNTKGLCYYKGFFHVFATSIQTVPGGYTNHVITHPTIPTATLVEIHFAQPFLGFLYVVAEFNDGSVFHYWLSSTGNWTANTIFKIGDIVEPTTPNGLAYVAQRKNNPNPKWTPSVPRAVSDLCEPTVYDGYFFTVTAVFGANPHSGTTEPVWNAAAGATTIEDADANLVTSASAAVDPATGVPSNVKIRYTL